MPEVFVEFARSVKVYSLERRDIIDFVYGAVGTPHAVTATALASRTAQHGGYYVLELSRDDTRSIEDIGDMFTSLTVDGWKGKTARLYFPHTYLDGLNFKLERSLA